MKGMDGWMVLEHTWMNGWRDVIRGMGTTTTTPTTTTTATTTTTTAPTTTATTTTHGPCIDIVAFWAWFVFLFVGIIHTGNH